MKKIAIITIYDQNNYGNRLQNYAVQEILKKRNFEVETLKNINIVNNINYLEAGLSLLRERRDCFTEFDKNLNISKDVIYHDKIPKDLNEKYDYFIIGSDQIWNYDFEDRFTSFVFAPFANKDKKISLSASFGTDYIPDDKINLYEGLSDLKAISVREEAGKKIVKEITGRDDAIVLIDPTMMLDVKEWNKVTKRPNRLSSKKYILKYFLGTVSKDRKREIQRIAREYNCDIIDVMDKKSFYNIGPSELLYLLKNSFLVVTDSFHACIFSILFNKPFVVFERKNASINMNSRLETLLSKFDLKDRVFKNKIEKEMMSIDYKNTYKILQEEKEKYNKFLDEYLES